jgi:trehalose 6-phosphate phosphatase
MRAATSASRSAAKSIGPIDDFERRPISHAVLKFENEREMVAETTAPISPRLSACTNFVLGNPRACALFLDVDGTLLDLAPTPELVRVPEGLIPLLQRLHHSLDGAVAIITGRVLGDIDHILRPLRLAGSGVHGAELRIGPDAEIERVKAQLPDDLLIQMRALANAFPGVIVEPKGPGLAVHYRLAPSAEPVVLAALEDSLQRHAGAFEILRGKKLFEIVPSGLSKGTALAALANLPAFRNRVPIMVGDDIGDEAAFSVAEGMKGFALRVAGEHYGDDRADFAGPRAVGRWLEQLAHRLSVIELTHTRH